MGSLFFSKYFMFLAFDFLDFVFFVEFRKYDVKYGFLDIWLSLMNGFC